MIDGLDINALAAAAAQEDDFTKEKQGGGDFEYELPEAGTALFRFREYIELGLQPTATKAFPNKKPGQKARLVFELVTPKHIKEIEVDGNKVRIAPTVSCTLTISNSPKSNFMKLFKLLNWQGNAVHPAQLLGAAYLGQIIHGFAAEDLENGKPKAGAKPRYANFQKDGVYTFAPPRIVDPIENTIREIPVPELLNPRKLFLWKKPTKECWDSIFIEGTRTVKENGADVEKSKNFLQEMCLKALDFKGSELQKLLLVGDTAGLNDLPVTEEKATTQATAPVKDPLADLGI